MDVRWIIERYDEDDSISRLIKEVGKQGMECISMKQSLSSFGDYSLFPDDDDCTVFYGSLNLGRQLQRVRRWIPGCYCNFKNFHCSTYYSYWGRYLLNQDYIMMPLSEVFRKKEEIYHRFGKNGSIFMRPNSGAKSFNGAIYFFDELDAEKKVIENYGGKPVYDMIAIISSPKIIEKEWRIVIVDKKPIAGSLYMNYGKIKEKGVVPMDVWQYSSDISSGTWEPDRAYVLDICLSEGSYYLLEANSFSCSGLYDSDVGNIVSRVSEIALQEWEEYNE